MKVKITIEKDDGTITVIENAVDWCVWDSVDVDGIIADYNISLSEEERKVLYDNVRDKNFSMNDYCTLDDLVSNINECLEEMGYKEW